MLYFCQCDFDFVRGILRLNAARNNRDSFKYFIAARCHSLIQSTPDNNRKSHLRGGGKMIPWHATFFLDGSWRLVALWQTPVQLQSVHLIADVVDAGHSSLLCFGVSVYKHLDIQQLYRCL